MPIDGIFLHCIRAELKNSIIGARVDKIYQPSRDELIFNLRNGKRLLFSIRANSPRIHYTKANFENPAQPSMLCMLFRKKLGGAVVTDVRQQDLDRVLFIDFLATNELGEKEKLTMVMEIMAQYSNVILINEENLIIDALKRVDFSKSSKRLILPGIKYELPPKQDKKNLFEEENIACKGRPLYKSVLDTIMGVSPLVARELAFRANEDEEELKKILDTIKAEFKDGSKTFYLLKDENGKPFDFSFMQITQYGSKYSEEIYMTASNLLDDFYTRRDTADRMAQRTSDLRKLLNNRKERILRKLEAQKMELENCADRENLRISAELISANLYKIDKGLAEVELENYYDGNNFMKIKLDPALSPAQNSQKYFKDYKKTYVAEKKLKEQIENGFEELNYIESVIDALSRAENEYDISQIKEELKSTGYLKKHSKEKGKKPEKESFLEYRTTDGFRVLVGRNNLQNDKLTMKTASKLDMWLHTKGFPGSHVIIENQNGEISDQAILDAAVIAAVNSTAKEAKKVPVDYTLVKNLKKPTGAKPGKVIFHENYTVYITPDEAFAEQQRVK